MISLVVSCLHHLSCVFVLPMMWNGRLLGEALQNTQYLHYRSTGQKLQFIYMVN